MERPPDLTRRGFAVSAILIALLGLAGALLLTFTIATSPGMAMIAAAGWLGTLAVVAILLGPPIRNPLLIGIGAGMLSFFLLAALDYGLAARTISDSLPSAESGKLIAVGTFTAGEKPSSGAIEVLELEDGNKVLALSDIEISPSFGPRVRIYAGGPTEKAAYIDVGRMEGAKGDLLYQLPSDYEFENYWSLIIESRFGEPVAQGLLSPAPSTDPGPVQVPEKFEDGTLSGEQAVEGQPE